MHTLVSWVFLLQCHTSCPYMFRPATYHHQGIKQSNTAQNQISHFYTQLTWCKRVKWLICRYFFLELLYTCDRSLYTVPWKQPTYLTKVSTVRSLRRLLPRFCKSKSITFIQLCKKCLHFNYPTLLHHVSCVQKWLIRFYAVFLHWVPWWWSVAGRNM